MFQRVNYREGCRRIYALATVAWIAGVIVATPAEQLRFWSAQTEKPKSWFEKNAPKPWEEYAAAERESSKAEILAELKQRYADEPKKLEVVKELGRRPSVNYVHLAQLAREGCPTSPPGYKLDPPCETQGNNSPAFALEGSRWEKFGGLASTLTLPPLCGYLLIFHVARWVYRGFTFATTK